MNSSEVVKQKRRFSKKPPFFILILFTSLFILAASASASVSIKHSSYTYAQNFLWFDRFHTINIEVTNTGNTVEKGIVELGLNDAPVVLAYFSGQKTCEPSFPYNVHRYYELGPGEKVSFRLEGKGIQDGTYKPYLLHATGCFRPAKTGEDPIFFSGQFKEPTLNNVELVSGTIKFGSETGNIYDQCDNPYTALSWLRNHGNLGCKEAECIDPSSVNSIARCLTVGECVDNTVQAITCANGQTVDVRTCVGSSWQNTGAVCPGQVLPPKPKPVEAGIGGGGAGLVGTLGLVAAVLTIVSILWVLLRKSGLLRM